MFARTGQRFYEGYHSTNPADDNGSIADHARFTSSLHQAVDPSATIGLRPDFGPLAPQGGLIGLGRSVVLEAAGWFREGFDDWRAKPVIARMGGVAAGAERVPTETGPDGTTALRPDAIINGNRTRGYLLKQD